MRAERRAALEDERRFLLDSIRDLDRERDAGDVDADDHRVLRDGYVARAAAVLRELESGRSAPTARTTRPWWRRGALVSVTLAVAAGLGVAVAQSAGQRLPGQSITGGLPMDEVAATLAQARASMSTDPQASLAAYDKVLALAPDNVEAITYRAWLLVLGGRGAGDATIIEAQLPELQRAISLDPDYADPHCLLAVATGRFLDPPQVETAATEAQACLDRNPPSMLVPMIENLVTGPTTTAP
ncbi:MAG: hypothetical protein ACO3C1_12345 [Ilumatobacteraceae bacterium]